MALFKVSKTTWKAKAGRGAMRIVLIQGAHSQRSGGIVPAMVLRFSGRTGSAQLAPPERVEHNHDAWTLMVANLHQSLDRDWVIEAESEEWARGERSLMDAVGRPGSKSLGVDGLEFLASKFPVSVDKEVLRTRDGMETTRVVHVRPADDGPLVVIATKRAGHPEVIEAEWVGAEGSGEVASRASSMRYSGLTTIGGWARAECADEADLRAHLGPVLLGWMCRGDYARLVRGGDNSDAPKVELWLDGFDHGGTGPRPAPRSAAPVVAPVAVPVAASRGDGSEAAPRPGTAEGLARSRVDRSAEAEALREDPSFGSF